MDFFSSWFLSPAVRIETRDKSFFANLSKQKDLIPISLTAEGGKPEKLSFSPPGNSHLASHMGALLASRLSGAVSGAKKNPVFVITIEDEAKKIIEQEPAEFLIGLLQKSVSNKVRKSGRGMDPPVKPGDDKVASVADKVARENTRTVILPASLFSKETIERAQNISTAMCYTRTLINMPPNALNPETYEKILCSLIKDKDNNLSQKNKLQITVLSADKLKEEGCGLICAVGQGSTVPPRLVKLSYTPSKVTKNMKHISLVGKGITFDSGGYDLKPSAGMRQMKKDMGGSAAAAGIFFAIARLNLPVRVSCFLPIAENMVSGNAMRPGDIYTARNGKFIEIDNTDAEGRLVLADAICLACEEKPDWLIDLATLTGAARVSLGTMIDSMFGTDEELCQLLYQTGVETGDWVWPTPLPADYNSYYDSNIADFMNSSPSGFAGSITAALFLQKFVDVPKWNHIDTYMWCDKPNHLWAESGATAKCVRLVVRAIEGYVGEV